MPSMNMVTPMVIRKERARIFRAGCFMIKSPMGLAKKRMAVKDTITAMIIIHILSVRPIAVMTESIEKTISSKTICRTTYRKPLDIPLPGE